MKNKLINISKDKGFKSKAIKEEMSRRVGDGEKPCDVAKDFGVTLAQPIKEIRESLEVLRVKDK